MREEKGMVQLTIDSHSPSRDGGGMRSPRDPLEKAV